MCGWMIFRGKVELVKVEVDAPESSRVHLAGRHLVKAKWWKRSFEAQNILTSSTGGMDERRRMNSG